MRQRVRLLFSAALPSLLFGVWATFLVLTGAAPVPAGGSVAAPPAVRFDGPQRTDSSRPELRRATSAPVAVQVDFATDTGARPPGAPPVLTGPVPPAYRPPVLNGRSVRPRQERAPPHDPYSPRHSRAPPSTRSS
ncbi:hypothetical protein ACFYWY_26180 [Streptomyces sp. NPDC002870]|uniref:hypothetical protein n=1 Tax=Streptomyces sp. NPDC002870 TaxID=3364666 RepID=UPI0036A72C0F